MSSFFIHDLEISLQGKEVRSDRSRLKELLHDDFVEFGRSGKKYRKIDILEELVEFDEDTQIVSCDFTYRIIDDHVVLLTYKSAHINSNNEAFRLSLRSSIWRNTEHRWQLIFHQGTPADQTECTGF